MARLLLIIDDLDHDKFPYSEKSERQQRATGCALNIALSVVDISGISTRFALLQGGPCTIGAGQVVGLPLKETMRTFLDIH
jgi:protein transport protein SEC23